MSKPIPILFFVLTALITQGQVNDGLVLKCTFNDGIPKDEVGKNTVKAIGAPLVDDRFGNKRSACYFHGSRESYLNLGTSPALKPNAGSISLWFEIETEIHNGSGLEVNPILITKSHAGDDFYEGYSILYDLNSDKLIFSTTFDQQHQVSIRSSETIAMRKWYHVVIAYNNKYLWAYLDGILQNDGKPIAKDFRSQFLKTDSVMLGHTANIKNERFLCGAVDDIYIFNRVINAAEVRELYKTDDPRLINIYLRLAGYASLFIGALLGVFWLNARKYEKRLRTQQEKSRLEEEKRFMELKVLRNQLNPHFLFNTLNNLYALSIKKDERTPEVIFKLSEILDYMLYGAGEVFVYLEKEITLLENYIALEKIRYGDSRLSVEFHKKIENDPKISPLILLTFVENAFKHGVVNEPEKAHISIHLEARKKNINFQIENTIPVAQPKNRYTHHIGLDNIKKQLELLYPGKHSLEIKNEDRKFVVKLKINGI
jgi:hypothetical protein